MKIWKWIKSYWYIPLFILGAIFLFIFFKKKGSPLSMTMAELEAISAGAEAEKLEAELGTVRAKAKVERKYNREYKRLTEEQKKEADDLAKNPKKLARFLVRAGRSR